jgi:hypothetical protein
MIENEVLREQLRQTEMALEDATNNIEFTRNMLRIQISLWHNEGREWKWIKGTTIWAAFVRLGGS